MKLDNNWIFLTKLKSATGCTFRTLKKTKTDSLQINTLDTVHQSCMTTIIKEKENKK